MTYQQIYTDLIHGIETLAGLMTDHPADSCDATLSRQCIEDELGIDQAPQETQRDHQRQQLDLQIRRLRLLLENLRTKIPPNKENETSHHFMPDRIDKNEWMAKTWLVNYVDYIDKLQHSDNPTAYIQAIYLNDFDHIKADDIFKCRYSQATVNNEGAARRGERLELLNHYAGFLTSGWLGTHYALSTTNRPGKVDSQINKDSTSGTITTRRFGAPTKNGLITKTFEQLIQHLDKPMIYLSQLKNRTNSIQARAEYNVSQQLFELSRIHKHFYAFALPADNDLINFHNADQPHTNGMTMKNMKRILTSIAVSPQNNPHDVFLPEKFVEKVTDTSGKSLDAILLVKFQQAQRELGFDLNPDNDAPLSKAQSNALWFHFWKFNIPDWIISALNDPKKGVDVNDTCKDAIDRGEVARLYRQYAPQIIELFKKDSPIPEVNQHIKNMLKEINVAASMVKGRPMNKHKKSLCNAMHTLIAHQSHSSLTLQLNKADRDLLDDTLSSLAQVAGLSGATIPAYRHGVSPDQQPPGSNPTSSEVADIAEHGLQSP